VPAALAGLLGVLLRKQFSKFGRDVSFEGWIDIPQRGGWIIIGDSVHICRRVEFSVPQGSVLSIGYGVFIGRGAIVSAHNRVEIGVNTMLGEYVSIHDNNRRTSHPGQPIASQGFSSEPIHISKNCWVGAHSILIKGCSLEAGCIVGAGAVVTKKNPGGMTVVGVPGEPFYKEPGTLS
jgi:acetyltransferase-like isoleucine patch superfamily enzyme